MHPIERLRYVARAGAAPDRLLVAESLPALSAFAADAGALLVAIRSLLNRQTESPGLLVLGATMLNALDPVAAGWDLVDSLDRDVTNDVADELSVHEAGGVELIESIASGPGRFIGPAGSQAWIGDAHRRGRTVALITPLGSRLPRMLWAGFTDRLVAGRVGAPVEIVDLDRVDELVGPDGVQPVASWSPDCADVAELADF